LIELTSFRFPEATGFPEAALTFLVHTKPKIGAVKTPPTSQFAVSFVGTASIMAARDTKAKTSCQRRTC
jgi:hypothetical protein